MMTWTCCGTGRCRRCSAGSFLRSFTWGNVLQAEKVSRLLLAELACRAPLLPGKDTVAFVDIDSTQKRVYGHAKQGAAFGLDGVCSSRRRAVCRPPSDGRSRT